MTPKARPASMDQNPFDLLQERNTIGRSNAMGIMCVDRAAERASSPSVLLTPGHAQGRMSTDIANIVPVASRNAPEFMIKLPPARARPDVKEATRHTGSAKGYLRVQIIEGRGLSVSSPEHSRPYVVVQFDKNEYIGYHEESTSDGTCPVWNNAMTFDVTTEEQSVQISVYDRVDDCEQLIGMRDIQPRLIHRSTMKRWYTLYARNEGPDEETMPCGEIHVQISYERLPPRKLTARDFEFLKLIGRGTFGRVFQVRKKDTQRIYAMKVLSKREIALKKEVTHTMGERKILEKSLDCPFLVGLKFSFQSETELFLVTDYKSGGELFWHLQREGRFTEARSKFYIAELILALEHLHKYDIVYRDLKPENILLDATGHVALCDFGLSKADLGAGELTNTFCGTTEYLAPEILLDEMGYSKLVDFWSLGVLLFEMCCGWSPFYAEDTQQMYRNICFGKIKFPRGAISDEGKQFVKGLLNRNPKHRLGAQNDAQDLKDHIFFRDMDWSALSQKQIPPVFKPLVESNDSVSNFDPEFTTADIREVADFAISDEEEDGVDVPEPRVKEASVTSSKGVAIQKPERGEKEEPLSNSVQEKFRGFSYSGSPESSVSYLENAIQAIDWGRTETKDV
ncbi:non-specific serine/threonine protein kinase [Malassezia equina]|uniref:Non-specific serine/threonine protein kinase n=1 Tax=Malassezia equina TaxID=1381935 RepID=A0AAF0IZM0_9BASI|nr:non-specific serine/threonine protein kinase [Malassezia equina]